MKDNKEKIKKDKKTNKFIETIKKKWLINGTKTFILIALIIAIFILINEIIQKMEITPIDLSQEKLYTLTDESKQKVKDIQKDVNIYLVGYSNDDSTVDLARQYKKENEKINAEAVDATSRPDLAQKYGIESENEGIIIECGDKSKVLTSNDLVTYDTTTYETISIAEQKLTSSILTVTSDNIPKVYFLEGYGEFSLSKNMNYLNVYLENEINEVSTLDVLTLGKIPDDCNTLVITTPNKDFDEIATNAIIEYINSGRNILWLNAAITANQNFVNVNKVLEQYGVKPFEKGLIIETSADKIISGMPNVIKPEIAYSDITKDLYNSTGIFLINATKINLKDEEKLEELGVTKTELLTSSATSFFRRDFENQNISKTESDESGNFLVGASLKKTISKANKDTGEVEKTSELIIYADNYFISDYQISSSIQAGAVQLAYNKDMILNSISYLVDRKQDITVRKNTGTVTYTATSQENTIIKIVIFAVPVIIIIIGILVWLVRRKK